jgi:hypothetical protein
MDGPERFIGKIADCQLETIANAGHFVSMGKTGRMCPGNYGFH